MGSGGGEERSMPASRAARARDSSFWMEANRRSRSGVRGMRERPWSRWETKRERHREHRCSARDQDERPVGMVGCPVRRQSKRRMNAFMGQGG